MPKLLACCSVIGTAAFVAAVAPPPIPASYTMIGQGWVDQEDVTLQSATFQRVGGTSPADWQQKVNYSVSGDLVGQHVQLTRADLMKSFVLLGPPGKGQKCLVFDLTNATLPPTPTPTSYTYLNNTRKVFFGGKPADHYFAVFPEGARISMYFDSQSNAPLATVQGTLGFQEQYFHFDPSAPAMEEFEVPAICNTAGIRIDPYPQGLYSEGSGVEVERDMPTHYPRMQPELVHALKTAFADATTLTTFAPQLKEGDIPKTLDRRETGNVARVRNQGDCGSCWAFSSAAAMETVLSVKDGQPPISISTQAIIDCSPLGAPTHNPTLTSCRGCSGGWPPLAFQNAINGTGIAAEDDYPYMSVDGTCQRTSFPALNRTIQQFQMITPGSEEDIVKAVAEHGAVVVIINVQADLEMYTGGVYDHPDCGDFPAHAVTVVGYDEESYLIKNSWGSTWGESGFFRMVRGKNMCGVANLAVVPIA